MRLCSCEHPSYIRNKYTGELIAAPCGQCNSCKNLRAKKWIDRLCTESKQHKYCWMVNLSYDDEHLPVLGYCEDNPLYLDFVNRKSNVRISLKELHDLCFRDNQFLQCDYDLLEYRLAHRLGLPCICTDDISRFVKRINKYIFTHITHHYENFRYFCAHEYGGATMRAHSHMLIWFDDKRVSKVFDQILHSCWTFGNIESSPVYSTGGINYVAQYVNLSTHLPAFYAHSKLRQRQQFSKCPSIGSFELLDKDLRSVYERKPTRRNVWDVMSSKYVDLPIQSSFKNRFFPKLQGYSDLSHSDRVTLYGICQRFDTERFSDFRQVVDDICWLHTRKISNWVEERIALYVDSIYDNLYHSFNFKLRKDGTLSNSRGETLDNFWKSFDNSLKRWFGISKRISCFSSMLGVSMDWLVTQIEQYWQKIDYENLIDFYSWQSDYAYGHDSRDLLCAYPEAYSYLSDLLHDGKEFPFDSDFAISLASFNILDCDDFIELNQTFDFKAMKSSADKIFKDTRKSKRIRSYLYCKRFERSDSALQKILINYNNDKKKYYECFECCT